MARIGLGLVTAYKGVWNTGLEIILCGVPFSLILMIARPDLKASHPCKLRAIADFSYILKRTEPTLTASITSYLYY